MRTAGKPEDESTTKLQNAVMEAVGNSADVKTISDRVLIEIRDIPEWSTSDDVLGAVFAKMKEDLSAEALPKLRKAYRGTQTATMLLPQDCEHTLSRDCPCFIKASQPTAKNQINPH